MMQKNFTPPAETGSETELITAQHCLDALAACRAHAAHGVLWTDPLEEVYGDLERAAAKRLTFLLNVVDVQLHWVSSDVLEMVPEIDPVTGVVTYRYTGL